MHFRGCVWLHKHHNSRMINNVLKFLIRVAYWKSSVAFLSRNWSPLIIYPTWFIRSYICFPIIYFCNIALFFSFFLSLAFRCANATKQNKPRFASLSKQAHAQIQRYAGWCCLEEAGDECDFVAAARAETPGRKHRSASPWKSQINNPSLGGFSWAHSFIASPIKINSCVKGHYKQQ